MANPPRIAHWVQIVMHYTFDLQEMVNVFNYRADTDPASPTDCDNIAFAFWQATSTMWDAIATSQVNFDRVVCKTLIPGPVNYEGVYYIPQPHPGTVGGDSSPGNVTDAVTWITGVVGRAFRGRSFIPPIPETFTLNGNLLGQFVPLVANLMAAILAFTGPLPFGLRLAVASRHLLELTPIFEFFLNIYLDSQRDRLPLHRKHRRRAPTVPVP